MALRSKNMGAFTAQRPSDTLADIDIEAQFVGVVFMDSGNKRLVLCFDGTWNAIADPNIVTNVVKIANCVSVQDPKGFNQICYYNSGVGSGGPIDRVLGGVFGAGLKNNVKRGLAFLTLNYNKGDEIYLFGFSRGAYTARAVAGVLGAVGIPEEIRHSEVHWESYRKIAKLRSQQRDLNTKSRRQKKRNDDLEGQITAIMTAKDRPKCHEKIKIKCIGVFDTVGSYGVPAGMGLSGLPHLFTYWTRGFHSRRIGERVEVALHAMAIDEMRRPFMPTFWMRKKDDQLGEDQIVEQMWFPGVHSNVGGGYDNTQLSDMSLVWMISRVRQLTDLHFDEKEIKRDIWPCAAGILYRSSKRKWLSKARSILPAVVQAAAGSQAEIRQRFRVNEYVHWSVKERTLFDKTPVDGVGFVKYAPGFKVDDHPDVSTLEEQLCSPNREWLPEKCPLKGANLPCECMTRVPHTIASRDPQQRTAA
jgi:uncharacterized protein (DUF2235 family)